MSSAAVPVAAGSDHSALPPHDIAAEQSVLGGMMLSADTIAEVSRLLKADDFYRPAHQAIYQATLSLFEAGEPADAVTVSAELERRGELARVGGAPYLHTLIATVPTAANAAYYAEIVAEKAMLRRLGEAGMRMQQLSRTGAQGTDEIASIFDQAQATLDTALNGHRDDEESTFLEMRDTEEDLLRKLQAGEIAPGVPTGLKDLDDVIGGGLRPGQFVVIAGRPGHGKSTLAVDMARTATFKHGKTSLIFSLEMSKTELWHRIVSAEARVRLDDIRTSGRLTPFDFKRIRDALDRTAAAPGTLIINTTATPTVAQLRATARRVKARRGLDLVIVDYLQLLTSSRRAESRQVEVSEFSRQLKLMAKDLDVPVVAACQLNRGPEQRADKRPMLSDLRESGAIEQDADIVILLHRPDAYEHDGQRPGEADLIVAKHRNGPTTTVIVAHQLHYSRFANLARD